jgi:hypothetical protein
VTTAGAPLSAILKRIRDMPVQPRPRPGERCELCSETIPDEHGHVVDIETRALMCACRPCYLAFTPEGAGGTRFRAVLDHVAAVPDFTVSDSQWESLQVPVGVAFFLLNSVLGRVVAFYPSPAGATESLLPLDAWDQIVLANPALAAVRPDVEAALVRRVSGDDVECFVVPIDVCYELVGELRMRWRGFDGGTEAHAAIDARFERIRARA